MLKNILINTRVYLPFGVIDKYLKIPRLPFYTFLNEAGSKILSIFDKSLNLFIFGF